MKGTVTTKGNRYYPVFDIGRDPATGKRRQKWGPGFKTKREAETWLTEAVSQVNRGTYTPRTKETIAEWCYEWLNTYARMHLRPNVWDSYSQMLGNHLIPFLGAKPLSALTANDLDTRYAGMVKAGLSPTTAGYLHRIMHTVLKVAVKKGKLSHNVARDADPPPQTTPIMSVWNGGELACFKEAARQDTPDYSPIYHMLDATGARIGEALGCQWRDLNLHLDSPNWCVQRTVKKRDNGEWLINPPKTKKAKRSIVLPQSLALVLRRLKEQREADAEYYDKKFSEDDYVFVRSDGTLPDTHRISKVFKNIAIRAGLKPIRLHDLRHTHATLLLLAGIHPKIVSERLGHASIAITLDIYSHVLPGMQEAAAAMFDTMMAEASENRMKELMLEKC